MLTRKTVLYAVSALGLCATLILPSIAGAQSQSSSSQSSSEDSSSSSSASSSQAPIGAISLTPMGVCATAGSLQTAIPKKSRCVFVVTVTDSEGNRIPSQRFKIEYRNIGTVRWKNLIESRTNRLGQPKSFIFRFEKSAWYRATTDFNGDRRVDAITTPFRVYIQTRSSSSSSSLSSASDSSTSNSGSSGTNSSVTSGSSGSVSSSGSLTSSSSHSSESESSDDNSGSSSS